MNIYVFGAGASQGSQGTARSSSLIPAPLTDELFANDIYKQLAAEVGITHEEYLDLRRQFNEYKSINAGTTLEHWLTEKWEDANTYGEQKRYSEKALFGRLLFYLWWLFQKVSNYPGDNLYKRLLIKIKDRNESCAFVSFNYDTLFDSALQEVYGYPLTSMTEYKNARLFKLHGSINWCLQRRHVEIVPFEFETVRDLNARIKYASGTAFNGPPLSMHNHHVWYPGHQDLQSLELFKSTAFDGQFFYPLMFLPLTFKSYNYVGGFDRQVITTAKVEFSKAENVILIGYKAQDELIDDLLIGNGNRFHVHIVSRSKPQTIYNRLAHKHGNLVQGITMVGFDTFLDGFDSMPFRKT